MGRRRKELASLDTVEATEPMAVDAADATEAEVFADSAEEQEVASVTVPTKWVVLEDTTVSLFGQMTLLPAGTVVSAASYGPIGIKRIMEQKVALAPVA